MRGRGGTWSKGREDVNKMMRQVLQGALAVLLTASVGLGAVGCDNKAGEDAKPVVQETAEVAVGDATSCKQYSEQFCQVAGGDQSQTCQAMKVVSDLMAPAACAAGLANIEYTKTALAGQRKKCDELVAKLCKDLGEETQSCAMVKQMTPQFPPERCTQMLGQYDAVLADLKRREDANKPLTEDKLAAITASDAPSFGPVDAPVTVVEFSDFQCPYCTKAAEAVDEIKKAYPDKVRVVFRQFPLSFHKDAHLAAQAALAAGEQGKFWEYHDLLFANQQALGREDLEKYAKEVGLDMKKFTTALDEGTYKEQVDKDLELGKQVAVQGTPTMFLNGQRVANATDFNSIKVMIDKELAGGEAK